MTVSSLVSAIAVGALVGVCGRWLLSPGRRLPVWLPFAVAVAAAVSGTVLGRLAGIDSSGLSMVELAIQVILAVAAVSIVVATAERRPQDHRYGPERSP